MESNLTNRKTVVLPKETLDNVNDLSAELNLFPAEFMRFAIYHFCDFLEVDKERNIYDYYDFWANAPGMLRIMDLKKPTNIGWSIKRFEQKGVTNA